MKLISLELVSRRSRSGEPAVHQRQQVPAKTALVGVAHEDFLVVLSVHCDFTTTDVIAFTSEGAVESNFFPVTMSIERDAALRRCLFEGRGRLELIDVDVATASHAIERKEM
jgi:hypothetical protein